SPEMRPAIASAAARSRLSRSARWRRMCSACLRAPLVTPRARLRGSRKFRAYPGATSTRSPLWPRESTSAFRITFTGPRPSSDDVRQQRDLAGVLDRRGDVALVAGAGARHAPRSDLAAIRDVLPQDGEILEVDVLDPLLAEVTDLLPLGATRLLAAPATVGAPGRTRGPTVSTTQWTPPRCS